MPRTTASLRNPNTCAAPSSGPLIRCDDILRKSQDCFILSLDPNVYLFMRGYIAEIAPRITRKVKIFYGSQRGQNDWFGGNRARLPHPCRYAVESISRTSKCTVWFGYRAWNAIGEISTAATERVARSSHI